MTTQVFIQPLSVGDIPLPCDEGTTGEPQISNKLSPHDNNNNISLTMQQVPLQPLVTTGPSNFDDIKIPTLSLESFITRKTKIQKITTSKKRTDMKHLAKGDTLEDKVKFHKEEAPTKKTIFLQTTPATHNVKRRCLNTKKNQNPKTKPKLLSKAMKTAQTISRKFNTITRTTAITIDNQQKPSLPSMTLDEQLFLSSSSSSDNEEILKNSNSTPLSQLSFLQLLQLPPPPPPLPPLSPTLPSST